MKDPVKMRANLALFFANALFGMNFSYFVSIIKHYMSFENLFYLRVLVCGLFFIPFILTRKRYHINWVDFLKIIATTILIIYGLQFMQLWGVKYTTPINASVLSTLGPVFTIIVSSIALRERIHSIKIVGILFAIIGGGILIFTEGMPSDGSVEFGNVLIVVSVFCAAVNTVLIKPVLMKLGVAKVMAWYYILGFVISTPFFGESFFSSDFTIIPREAWVHISVIIVLGTVLPNFLLYYGTERLTSVHTGIYSYILPITATVFAILREQEQIDLQTIICSGLIFVGVLLVIYSYKLYSFPIPKIDPSKKINK